MAKKNPAQTKKKKTAKKSGAGKAARADEQLKLPRGFTAVALSVLAALLVAMSVRAFGFTLVVVRSDAMNDTLFAGDIVLVSRGAQPEAGNIVLAGALNGNVLRRVIGEPGDTVSASGGEVLRNGMELYEPYASGTAQWDIPQTRLQDGVYLLMPDNRTGDSALVKRGGIAGVVRAVVWPLAHIGFF